MLRSSRSPASRFPQKPCANATGKAPSGSAGSAGCRCRGKCAIAAACWSAGAWARRHFRRSCSRPRRGRCCAGTAAATQFIDLVNVSSGGGITSRYVSALHQNSGTLFISSGGVQVAAISMVAHYSTGNFQITARTDGTVVITDPAVPNGGNVTSCRPRPTPEAWASSTAAEPAASPLCTGYLQRRRARARKWLRVRRSRDRDIQRSRLRIAWYVGHSLAVRRQRSDEGARKRGQAPTPIRPYRTADASMQIWPSPISMPTTLKRV